MSQQFNNVRKTVKMLPHEWAASTANQHHRLRLQITDSNGTYFASGSYSRRAQAEYVASLYRGVGVEIVDGHCYWQCNQCEAL